MRTYTLVLGGILAAVFAGAFLARRPAQATKVQPPKAVQSLDTYEGRVASGFQIAMVSWYGAGHHGRTTAAGAHKSKDVPRAYWKFDRSAPTCAHRTLPFGTQVLFCLNGRWAIATVTDRGPYPGPNDGPRQFDLSEGLAEILGFRRHGLAFAEYRVLP